MHEPLALRSVIHHTLDTRLRFVPSGMIRNLLATICRALALSLLSDLRDRVLYLKVLRGASPQRDVTDLARNHCKEATLR